MKKKEKEDNKIYGMVFYKDARELNLLFQTDFLATSEAAWDEKTFLYGTIDEALNSEEYAYCKKCEANGFKTAIYEINLKTKEFVRVFAPDKTEIADLVGEYKFQKR